MTRLLSCALPGGANIFAVDQAEFLSGFASRLSNPETCALGNTSLHAHSMPFYAPRYNRKFSLALLLHRYAHPMKKMARTIVFALLM